MQMAVQYFLNSDFSFTFSIKFKFYFIDFDLHLLLKKEKSFQRATFRPACLQTRGLIVFFIRTKTVRDVKPVSLIRC